MTPLRRRWVRWVGLAALVMATLVAARAWRRPDPARLLAQAQADYQAGRLESAAAALTRLEQWRPPTPMDRMARARVANASGRPDRALEELKTVPDDHPIAPIAQHLQGQVETELGRLPAAEQAFLDAIRLEPRFVQARRELAFIYSLQQRLSDLDVQLAALAELGELPSSFLLHWTKTRNVNWDYGQDLDELRRFVSGDPEDRWSRLALAEGLRRSGELDEAERVLEPLLPADPEALAILAASAVDRARLDRAESLLAEGPADHPSIARLWGELAMVRNEPEAALGPLLIAERADPTDRRVLFLIGRALTLLDRPDEAEHYLDAVRRHDALGQLISKASTLPDLDDPQLCFEIGSACLALGRRLEARAWFDAAISVDPLHSEAQEALARMEREG